MAPIKVSAAGVLASLAILAALFVLCPASEAWAEIGRVKKARGEAFIERAGVENIPAAPGVKLETKDILVTGPDGRISVTFIDNSRFAAGPDSRVTLEQFEFNSTTHEGEFQMRVEQGSLAIISGQIAKHEADAMKVHTPTSILGVRGTRFIVEVRP